MKIEGNAIEIANFLLWLQGNQPKACKIQPEASKAAYHDFDVLSQEEIEEVLAMDEEKRFSEQERINILEAKTDFILSVLENLGAEVPQEFLQ